MKSKNWMMLLSAGLLSAAALFPFHAAAQDYVYATGNPNFGVNYPIPGGYINVTNGNVHITIPLGTFKQRGNLPPVKINLEYDSRIWKINDNGSYSWQPNNVPNSMAGWRLTTGLEQGALSFSSWDTGQTGSCGAGQETYPTQALFTGFVWTDGQGTQHTFSQSADLLQSLALPPCQPNVSPSSSSGWAVDGSGYYLVDTYESGNGCLQETYPDNSCIQTTIYDNNGNQVYPNLMDPYGNTATLTSDSIGRNLVTTTTNGNTIQYDVPKEGGGTNTFTVTTGTINVNTNFGQSDVSEFSGSLTAIQSIQLPDGSSYSFSYDPGSYGELTSMTLPTGGVVSLSYINYLDSYNNYNRWISTETENGNSTNFNPNVLSQCTTLPTGCQEKMTVDRPSGDSRVYTLTMNDGAWDGETDTYQGGSKIMTVVNKYNFNAYPCTDAWLCTGGEYIAASSSTVTLDDTGQTAQTLYSYDAPWSGKVNSIQEFDYGVTGTPTRETDYTYNGDGNGTFLVSTKKELFNGALFSETAYPSYDAVKPTTEVKGLPGQVQATTKYTYDNNGMKVSMTDPNGNVTSYSYGCSDLYLSQTTYPSTSGVSHITQANPDCNSGDPLSKTDQNGQITTYDYTSCSNGNGRICTISYPDGGKTTYQYPSPNEVVQSKLLSGSTSSTLTTTWDGYGRKSQVSQSDPAGDDAVTYSYDGDNRVLCTSNPQRTGSAPTNGSTCVSYDALDRPLVLTQPDNNTIQVSYSGNQATVTDENGHQKRYQYDAFHDLTAVWEPNASGTPSWETTYTYDATGHVTGMTQNGDGSSAARTRTFVYDDLGRLTSEATPETGAKSYGYDANGNVVSSTNAPETIAYSYDALNRMTSKSAPGINYVYSYDAVSGLQVYNTIGRLVAESNMVNADEVYSYDAMGRLNWEASWMPTSPNNTSIITRATYDLAGDLTSITYPDSRVISESYDSAQHLTGIQYASWNGQSVNTSYYSPTGFAPPGETTNATLGNGVQMAASFNSRQSIAALSYATAAQTLWSKQYTWAPNAKNLLQIADMINTNQVYNYGYDPDNRLTSAAGGAETLVSPATPATGSISISGYEQSGYPCQTYCPLIYDSGSISVELDNQYIGGTSYGEGDTPYTLSANLAASINESTSLVSAVDSGGYVTLTSKATGTAANYPNFSVSVSDSGSDPSLFSSPSFSASTSGPSLTGGTNAVYSTAGIFSETYTVDPWGNQQESGNFNFQQSYNPANNQINGYSYDAAGDLLGDGMNTYAYDGEGMLTSANEAQYVYDALQQRVEKTGGSNPTEVVYFNGHPIALLNPSTGAWTDLIWAGSNLLAEVAGTQAAVPVYRLLDHEGSLVATTDGSGNVTGTNLMIPYGETLSSNTNDPYAFTGLYQDTEYGGDDAWYRNYSTEQSRWLTPDPYNGSYDLNNPQSFNRYMYVNGNPLGNTDPSGLAGAGVLTGIGGSICTGFGNQFNNGVGTIYGINPCSPLTSIIGLGISETLNGIFNASLNASLNGILGGFGVSSSFLNVSIATTGEIAPIVGAAFTIGCSIDSDPTLCGQQGWASVFIGGNGAKVTNDVIATAGATAGVMCAASAGSNVAACGFLLGYAIYTAANDLFSVFWDAFGPAQFTGSLLPRPTDLGGLGTSPIGIPNQNLSIKGILGQPSRGTFQSPGLTVP